MNRLKKSLTILLGVVLCAVLTVATIPFASALSKPASPKKVLYSSDYAVQEHCVEITPASSSTGFQVKVVNASGNTTFNKYYNCSVKTREFYKLDKVFILWDFHKHIGNGQFYKISVRAFNASNYNHGKPKASAKYSGWTSTYAAETVTGAKAVRVDNKKKVKISWDKTKGATCYTLRFSYVDNKYVGMKSMTTDKTSVTLSKVGNIQLKNAKKISLEIVPVKLDKYAYRGASWKIHNLTIK